MRPSGGGYLLPLTPKGGYRLGLAPKCLGIGIAIGHSSTDSIKACQAIADRTSVHPATAHLLPSPWRDTDASFGCCATAQTNVQCVRLTAPPFKRPAVGGRTTMRLLRAHHSGSASLDLLPGAPADFGLATTPLLSYTHRALFDLRRGCNCSAAQTPLVKSGFCMGKTKNHPITIRSHMSLTGSVPHWVRPWECPAALLGSYLGGWRE